MNDLGDYRHPMVRFDRKVSAGATNEEINIGPVPAGKIWVITRLAFEDETTAFTYARGFLSGYGEDVYLFEEREVLAARLYWDDQPLYIPEGRGITCRFNGTTSGDKLAFYVNGFQADAGGVP